ncbi:hypothetical protein FCV82_02475 [Vibrio breoganii]|uniref:hypothetical protein n=1 Tax=Vibrio breoganii TaxID=553239 RepID=UPI000C865083|nr:hypothetical protein [Vibrio breoganii]PMN72720.1 hypothetical protein BCT28_16855 [Vibrio breoganii]PMO77933.1 hypothetical protein BCT00_18005 [Vibrio breoganii]TKF90454.1 hypothetical protein FCV82_02475 [Vibrio breoganii]
MDILLWVMGGAICLLILFAMFEHWKGTIAIVATGITLFFLTAYTVYICAIAFVATSALTYMNKNEDNSVSLGGSILFGAKVAIVIFLVAEALGWLSGAFTGSSGSCGRHNPSGC